MPTLEPIEAFDCLLGWTLAKVEEAPGTVNHHEPIRLTFTRGKLSKSILVDGNCYSTISVELKPTEEM